MAEPMELYADTYMALGFDLQPAIDAFTVELAGFALTEGVPAPAAHVLVEQIVRYHDGLFVIVPPPEPPAPNPLPADPKYYKSKADMAKVAAEAAKQAAAGKPPPEAKPE